MQIDKIEKNGLLNNLLEQLRKELAVVLQATRAAREAATHEESKPEDQYDTRGLEASYLAGAQAQRATEIENNIRILERFTFTPAANEQIASGCLVELECDEQSYFYLVLPVGGGTRLELEKGLVTVVTPSSSLGKELLGRKSGAGFTLQLRGQTRDYEISKVR